MTKQKIYSDDGVIVSRSLLVSVVIPNWNGLKYLDSCLQSLRDQTFSDFEVILVDNGSTDGSVEFVRSSYPTVRVIEQPENLGFAAAVNRGIESAAGKYVALLNNDTRTDENWLVELINTMENDPSIGFCSSRLVSMNRPDLLDGVWDCFTLSGLPYRIGYGEPSENRYLIPGPISGACAAAAIYRRDLFRTFGTFDEEYFAYVEDVELALRFFICGIKGQYVPSAVVHHHGGGTSGGEQSTLVLELSVRNVMWTIVKLFPGPLVPFTLLLAFIRWMLACAKLTIDNNHLRYMGAFWRGILFGVRGMDGILQKRSIIQRQRQINIIGFVRQLSLNSRQIRKSKLLRVNADVAANTN